MKVTEKECTHLSDGRMLRMTKYRDGRTWFYTVMLGGLELLEAPTLHQDLTKDDAYRVYGDYIRADVLELAR